MFSDFGRKWSIPQFLMHPLSPSLWLLLLLAATLRYASPPSAHHSDYLLFWKHMSSWVIGWGWDVSCWMLPGTFGGQPHAWPPLLPLRLVIEQHFPDTGCEPWGEGLEFPRRVTESSDREKLFWYFLFSVLGFVMVSSDHWGTWSLVKPQLTGVFDNK